MSNKVGSEMLRRKITLVVIMLALGLVLAVSGCGPRSEAASPEPDRIVESFYAWYLDYPGNAIVDGAYRSSDYLSQEFVEEVDGIIASFDKGGYDPFLCAQDVPESFSLGEPVVSGDIARVVIRTSFEGHAFTAALLREAGDWKMSDVLCEADEAEEPSFESWQTFSDEDYGFALRYPADWGYEEAELRPPEETPDAEKALKRLLFFQPQDWNGVAPPLHIQVIEGNDEALAKLHVPPDLTEELSIGDQR